MPNKNKLPHRIGLRGREAIAAGKMVAFKVDRSENLADLLTKSVPGHRRKHLRLKIMITKEEEG